jgi:hypothetical protein
VGAAAESAACDEGEFVIKFSHVTNTDKPPKGIPPVGEITDKTDDDCRSNTRPIELIDSPRCQISARCEAE